MKLTEIRIENFRSFKDETIRLDDYTCLVGPNGTGKSAVLTALNVFFRNNADAATNVLTLGQEDFHYKHTDEPVKITLTFENLSEPAREDFKHYYRSDKLVLFGKAEWDSATMSAEVKQYGSRLVMEKFSPFFAADERKAKVPELREIYKKIRHDFPKLPSESTKVGMTTALRSYETEHPQLCSLVDSQLQAYGWARVNYLMERHLQWVYIPAVKHASTEQEEGTKTALGQLLQRTIRAKVDFDEPIAELKKDIEQKYVDLLGNRQALLEELQRSLEKRFQEWATPRAKLHLDWHHDLDKSVIINQPAARVSIGEDRFMGEVARLGHGLQRAFIVSMLQELATSDDQNQPTLLLGFEEPELYLHPPQALHVANLLQELCTDRQENSQVLTTTHSPYFVSGKGFESIRMVRKNAQEGFTTVTSTTYTEVNGLLAPALSEKPKQPTTLMALLQQVIQPSQRELFFTSLAILVEGIEDVAFISSYMQLSQKWGEFRKSGCHFVMVAKTNMPRMQAIAQRLGIPVLVVFDSDSDAKKPEAMNSHRKYNTAILALAGVDPGSDPSPDAIAVNASKLDPMPVDTLWRSNLVMWHPKIGDVVHQDFGAEEWLKAETAVKLDRGFTHGVNQKNCMLIAATLERLWSESKRSASLEKVCEAILEYASR